MVTLNAPAGDKSRDINEVEIVEFIVIVVGMTVAEDHDDDAGGEQPRDVGAIGFED